MIRLCYIVPGADEYIRTAADPDDLRWLAWLYLQIEKFPKLIFFYTIETTNI